MQQLGGVPQTRNRIRHDFLRLMDVLAVEQVHRIKNNPQVFGLHLRQHPLAPFRRADNVPRDRLDSEYHALFLCPADNRLHALNKQAQALLRPALRTGFVTDIGRAGFRADHQRADFFAKPQMRTIIHQRALVRRQIGAAQVQIAPQQHAPLIVLLQQPAHLIRQRVRQQLRRIRHLKPRYDLAHRDMNTGKPLLPCVTQVFIQITSCRIMQPNSDFHVATPFYKDSIPHFSGERKGRMKRAEVLHLSPYTRFSR